jgi:hypothetical protein
MKFPRTLLIDDVRDLPAQLIARTYDDGIRALELMGPWDVLLLDHDLSDADPTKTGSRLMNWLEEHPQFLPNQIRLVTSNPVGRKYMEAVIERLYPTE